MAIIDPEGLFSGERFERVSDSARFAWPYLFLGSNTLGRIELNYRSVIGRVFSRFRQVPTEEEFWGWVAEYQNAFLLFVYSANGAIWGQWDTSEKFLPKHKLAKDKNTPAPDGREFTAWKDKYVAEKQAHNATKPIVVSHFKNPSEILPKRFENNSEGFRANAHGVGFGVGGGSGSGSGKAVGESGASDHASEKTGTEARGHNDADGDFDTWAESVYARWKKHRDRTLAHQALVSLALGGSLDRASFEANLELWLRYHERMGWQYAPSLAAWLTDDGWKYPPPAPANQNSESFEDRLARADEKREREWKELVDEEKTS